MYKEWNGLLVPERDSENVLLRRWSQCERALDKVAKLDIEFRVMVQAGGNWGYWPRRFSDELFQTVYTFEPDSVCFTCLATNTAHQSGIVRLQAALGGKRELVDLWRDVDTTGNQHVEGHGIYPTLLIDDLGLDTCDLIYLDIEGRELEALRGAVNTIERCHPVVVFEARSKFSDKADAVYEMLTGIGYEHDSVIDAKDQVMRFPRQAEC